MNYQKPFFAQVLATLATITLSALGGLANGQTPSTSGQTVNASGQTTPVAAIGSHMRSAGFLSVPAFKLNGIPSGLLSTDLDGDGEPDLVVAFASEGKVAVFLGAGNGRFQAPMEYSVGGHPAALAAVDIDGDGRLDVVTANGADGTVSVLLGVGAGKLAKSIISPVGADADYLAAIDLNGDGSPDVVVASRKGKALGILLNDGHGGLGPAAFQSLSNTPTGLVVGDFNGDRHLDAALANDDGTVQLLLGGGDGTLAKGASFVVSGAKIWSMVAADFNHDGTPDLAVTQGDGRLLTTFLGNGDGTFALGTSYPVGNGPVFTAAIDVNKDGVMDLITVNKGSNTVSVLLGNGDGTFQNAKNFTVGDDPVAVALGDFYSTGYLGLAVIDGSAKILNAIAGKGDGTFRAAPAYSGDLSPRAIASGDLNRDGLPDVVVTNFCGSDAECAKTGSLSVYLGQVGGGYQLASTYAVGTGPVSVALADLNGDGNLDVLVLNRGDKTLSTFLGAGDGTLQAPASTALVGSPVALIAKDFNKDGAIDLAVVSDCGSTKCTQLGSVDVYFGGGDGTFSLGQSYPVSYSPSSIAAGDLNGDSILDLVVANACGKDATCNSTGTATVLLGGEKGSFAAQADVALGNAPSSIALRNATAKAAPELVIAQASDNTVAVLKGNGNGTFGTPVVYPVGGSPRSLAIADLNGDGTPDVAVANAKDSTVSVLYGNADGTLVSGESYAVAAGPEALIAVAGTSGLPASLVTASGNSKSSAAGREITSLFNAAPNGSTTSMTSFTSVTPVNPTVNVAVTMQATVTPLPPDGETVTFSSDDVGALNCASTTTLGVASCTTSQLTAGSRTLTASYGGDQVYAASSGTQPLMVTAAPATLSLTGPSTTPTVNQTATFTATLSSAAGFTPTAPSGTIAFTIGGQNVPGCAATTVSAAMQTATCSYIPVSTATLAVAATYMSDNNFAVASQPTLSQPVSAAAATLSLAGPSATPTVNQVVTFTATLASATGYTPTPPSGMISFTVGGQPVGGCLPTSATATLLTATCSYTATSPGNLAVAATYTNDANFTVASQPTLSQAVNAAPATLALTGPSTTPTVNQTVTFTAALASAAGYTPTAPAGMISFTVGNQPVSGCSATTVSATALTATCSYTLTSATTQAVAATYNGDNNFTVANQPTLSQPVNAAPATLTLTGPSATPTVNQPITLSATLASSAGYTPTGPSGTIAFTINGQPFAGCLGTTASAAVLTASCSYTPTSTATLAVAATYTGDTNFIVANQPTLSQPVNAASATLNVSGPSTPPTVNQSATYTATFASTAGYTPTPPSGMITFTTNGQPVAGCAAMTVSSASLTASCTYTALAAGSLAVVASYSGDTNFTVPGGSSPTLTQTINKIPTTLNLSQPAPSTINTNVTFTATLVASPTTPTAPGGSISFTVNGDSSVCPAVALSGGSVTATCVTSKLVYPSDVVVATYSGDANYVTPASVSVTQIVSKINAQTTVSVSTTSAVVNQPVTFTATLQGTTAGLVVPSGSVTFRQGSTVLCGGPVAIAAPASSSATTSTAVCQTTFSAVNAAGNTVTATYSGDSNFNPGAAGTAPAVTVGPQTTTLALASSLSPSAVDQMTTFTATISYMYTGTAVPAGTITFVDQTASPSTTLCASVAVASGSSASCAVPLLFQGVHAIVASFTASGPGGGASPNFGNSTSPTLPQTVNAAPTTLSIVTSSPSVAVNASVTFTATVTKPTDPSYTGSTLPAGTIAFSDGAITIAGCSAITIAINGTATCPTTFTTAATHTINAVFTPSTTPTTNFLTSSGSVAQVVGQASTSITLTSSSSNSTVNQAPVLTALFAFPSGNGMPSGSLTFTDASTGITLCTVSLPGGSSPSSLTCAYAFLVAGTRSVQAAYAGDANFGASSGSTTQVVRATGTTLAVSSQSPTSLVNQPVTLNSVLTPSAVGASKPQGTVTITDALTNSVVCSLTVGPDGSVPTCTTSFLVSGAHSLSAGFAPSDGNFILSSAPTVNQTVQADVTTLSLTSSSGTTAPSSSVDQAVTFTVNLGQQFSGLDQPKGTVTVTDSLTNSVLCSLAVSSTGSVPLCTTSFLVAGTHPITASFIPADSNFVQSNAATLNQMVQPTITTLLVTSSSGPTSPVSVAMQPVTFTATLVPAYTGAALPAGSIAFTLTGDTVDTCPTVPVVTSAQPYTATCKVTFASSISGQVVVKAVYTPAVVSGITNFVTSTSTVGQTVQNFQPAFSALSLATAVSAAGSPISSPMVTQGYSNLTDPFTPSTITLTSAALPAAPLATFADPLTVLSCAATSSAGAVLSNFCTIAAVPNSGSGTIATLTLTPGATAPAGSYTVVVMVADSKAPALVQPITFIANVVAQTIPSSLSAGAATGAFNATFGVPNSAAGDTFTYACGAILFNKQATSAITCTANPTTGLLSATPFTITASSSVHAMATPLQTPAQRIFASAFFGVPLLAMVGCFRRKQSRRSLLRFLAALTVLACASQAIGCGGGFTTTSSTGTASTGPAVGTYLVLVTATDQATHVTYDGVISVSIRSATGS